MITVYEDDISEFGPIAGIVMGHIRFTFDFPQQSITHNGRVWIRIGAKETAKVLSCFSEFQVRRAFNLLVRRGILIADNFNGTRMDQTKWYAINRKWHERSL